MKKMLCFIIILLLVVDCGQPQQSTATPQSIHITATPDLPSTSQPPAATLTPAITPLPDDSDGMIAFTSAQDGNMEVYIMNANGGDPQRLTNHPGEDYWSTWSPDGAQIAFASERDGDFEIYAMNADGSNLRRLTHEPGNDLEPAWSPNGAKIAFMVYQDGKSDIYVMNADGGERRLLTDSDGDNYLPKWSPDGTQIVFVSERDGNPEIYVMNADGDDQRRLTDNPADDLYPSWSSDGRQISFYSERDGGRELYVMDADGHSPHPLTHDNAFVWVSDWSPDGRIAFTSNRDGNREIYVMDIDGSNLQRLTNNNVLDGIPAWRPVAAESATALSPPTPPSISLYRASISPENAADVVQLWQTEMPNFLDFHETCGVAFSPDGEYLAAACRSPIIPLWDVATGQLVRTFGGGGYVWTNVAFSPDGETLASSGQESAISLWNVATGERVKEIRDAPGYMSEVVFSPDGQLLASGSFLGSAVLWDVAATDASFEFFGHNSRVNCIDFSPDGRLLVTGGGDNKARVWEASSGEETLVLSGATYFIEDVEFAPSGLQIVGASDNSRIYLWDADNGNLLQTFKGHKGPVNGVTYSPDGRLLASTSNDQTLRLWDVGSGENLARLTGHSDLVIRSTFNPAGSLIASVSWDGTVRLWGLPESADESRADGLSEAEAVTLSSLEQVDDYPLYTMRYQGAFSQRQASAMADTSWACSLFAALGDEENMVYGRNFDWRYSPALLLFTDPPGGYASVSMVDIGYLVGAENASRLIDLPLAERTALLNAPFLPFDGMNEHGLVIGMAAVPPGNVPFDPDKETVGSLAVMRQVLDQARDVDEAVAIFQSYNIEWGGGPDLHYLVADQSGRSILVEFYQGETILIPNPADEPWHQATNFLRASVGESAAGECWRYDYIGERLMDVDGRLTTSSAMNLLTQVAQENTQWSIVYGLSAGAVTVTMGQDYGNQHTFIFSEVLDE